MSGGNHRLARLSWRGEYVVRLVTPAMIVLVLLTGCGPSDSVYLPALLDDPMAHYSHPDLEVDNRGEMPKGEDFITGGPLDPHVITFFVVDGDVEPVIADAVTTAERSGWVFTPESPLATLNGGMQWYATKELPEGKVQLDVILEGPARDHDVVIRLSFEEESLR